MKWLLLLAALVLMIASSDGRTLFVDPTGRVGSRTLADSIAMASPGDKIVVMPGSYYGATVDRSLSISGSGRVVIKGEGNSALIIGASGCRISNLYIEGSGSSSGLIIKSSDNVLDNCSLKGGPNGIEVQGTNNTVSDSRIDASLGMMLVGSKSTVQNDTFNGDKGIQMKDSSENVIKSCRFSTSQGIEITSSNNNNIEMNRFSGTSFGITLSKSGHNSLAENQFSGSYISGLDLLESSDNNLTGNLLNGSMLGISLRQSDKNLLTNNSCVRNERAGVYLNGSTDNQLIGNSLSKDGNGILLAASEKNTIVSNAASDNTYGISLRGSGHNILKNNSMKANLYNLRIDSGSSLVQAEDDFFQDIDVSNSADGKPICYLVEQRERVVLEGYAFVGLIECRNVSVSNQSISNSSTGVLLVGSTDCNVENCTIRRSENGVSMINSKNCTAEKCQSLSCKTGFLATRSSDNRLEYDVATNSSDTGLKIDGSSGLLINGGRASGGEMGLWIKNSPLCRVLDCIVTGNKDTGLGITSSPDCTLQGVKSALNKEGINIVGSNGCKIDGCNASANSQDGLALLQLSDVLVTRNIASANGQGIYVQSSKNIQIRDNNLSANTRHGLRMSMTSGCNITDNSFTRNQISGVNLVDCRGNDIYHNVFIDNIYQNAADNGNNLWDSGPKVGGNYWSDFKATGNPGDVPRIIPSNGVDRYPFQNPRGWS